MQSNNPHYNAEGYADPTAYEGTKKVIKADNESEERANKIIKTVKNILELSGFELISRIKIKDCRTGREYK